MWVWRGRGVWLAVQTGLLLLWLTLYYRKRDHKERSEQPEYYVADSGALLPVQSDSRLERLRDRAETVASLCSQLSGEMMVERAGLGGGTGTVNRCTNTYFSLNQISFVVCNVLKGGSLSWKTFFEYYKASHKKRSMKTVTWPQ